MWEEGGMEVEHREREMSVNMCNFKNECRTSVMYLHNTERLS